MPDEPVPVPPSPQSPQNPQPTIFDKTVEKVNNFVGFLNFQLTLTQEQLSEKDEEINRLKETVRGLEAALAPFLAHEQAAKASAPETSTEEETNPINRSAKAATGTPAKE